MQKLRTPIRALAVVGLAGSMTAGVMLATAGSAVAKAKGKTPVAATCTSSVASTTITAATSGQPISALLSGCSGGKSSPQGVDTITENGSDSGGTGTILWTDKKTTTFTFTNSTSGTTFSCPTFLNQTFFYKEIITTTGLGGNAKITANGTSDVCVYGAGSDGTVYEAQVGSGTI